MTLYLLISDLLTYTIWQRVIVAGDVIDKFGVYMINLKLSLNFNLVPLNNDNNFD